jgi:uncharacterized protein (TIGR04255 family)
MEAMVRHYEEPPVIEALCEVRFVESQWDTTIPGVFYDLVKSEYPRKHSTDLDWPGDTSPGPTRSQFSRLDGTRMVQVAPNLLVVNQLRPYTGFESWAPTVAEMVTHYRTVASPVGVLSLAMRYINRVDFPNATEVSLEEFFRVYPKIPHELTQDHEEFLLRFEVPKQGRPEHRIVVTLASVPAERGLSVLFDLYDEVRLKKGFAFEALTSLLNDAHAMIANAFEACITDAARVRFVERK